MDEILFPPRCCKQKLNLSLVKSHMDDDLPSLLESKSVEFNTLKRVYCAIVSPGMVSNSLCGVIDAIRDTIIRRSKLCSS